MMIPPTPKKIISFLIYSMMRVCLVTWRWLTRVCTEDDGDLDPLHAGDEGDGEEKDIAGKGDKDGDEEGILHIEWEIDVVVPDGEEDDRDDQDCENPPDEFC